MQRNESPIVFPRDIIRTFGVVDKVSIKISHPEESRLFKNLYCLEQMRDQYQAYLYVEETFSRIQFQTIDAKSLEKMIRDVHRIAAKSLLLAKPDQHSAGEYNNQFMIRTKGSAQGHDQKNHRFDEGAYYTENNKKILFMLYGEQVANNYEAFYSFIKESLIPEGVKLTQQEALSTLIDFLANHAEDPRCQAFKQVYHVVDKRNAQERMLAFCHELLRCIRENKHPIYCAAFALFHLSNGNFFSDGNKLTARIIMNGLLNALQNNIIYITKQDANRCNFAMEQSTSDNLSPLLEALDLCDIEEQEVKKVIPLKDNFYPFNNDNFFPANNIICYEKYFLLKAMPNHFEVNTQADKKLDCDFFLQKAIKYSKNIPSLASFYLEACKGLSSEINTTPLKIEQVAKLLQKNAIPCPVIYLAPNETARITKKDVNVAFCVKLGKYDVAFIFRDSNGKVSVTHVDPFSNKNDIWKREASFMEGKFTMDIFPSQPEYRTNLLEIIERDLGEVTNSEGKKEFRFTKTGLVFIHRDKILFPTESVLSAFSPDNQFSDTTELVYCGYRLKEPAINRQYRDNARKTILALSHCGEKPVVIFQNDWTGHYPVQTDSTVDAVRREVMNIQHEDKYIQSKNRSNYIRQKMELANQTMNSHAIEQTEAVMRQIISYFHDADPVLYFQHLTQNLIALPKHCIEYIAEYADSQEEIFDFYQPWGLPNELKTEADSSRIDIKGLTKAEVLMTLFNHAKPLSVQISLDEAELFTRESLNFDYAPKFAKSLKVDIAGDSFDSFCYDRDNGAGVAKQCIDKLRVENAEKRRIRQYNVEQLGAHNIEEHLLQRLILAKAPLLNQSASFTGMDAENQCNELADLLDMYFFERQTDTGQLKESKQHFIIIASLTSLYSLYSPLIKNHKIFGPLFSRAEKIESCINTSDYDDFSLGILVKFRIAMSGIFNNSYDKSINYLLRIKKPTQENVKFYELFLNATNRDTVLTFAEELAFANQQLLDIHQLANAYQSVMVHDIAGKMSAHVKNIVKKVTKLYDKNKSEFNEKVLAYQSQLTSISTVSKKIATLPISNSKTRKELEAQLNNTLKLITKFSRSLENQSSESLPETVANAKALQFVEEYRKQHPEEKPAEIRRLEEYLNKVGSVDEKEDFIENNDFFEVDLKTVYRLANRAKPHDYPQTYRLQQNDIEEILSERLIERSVYRFINQKLKPLLSSTKNVINQSDSNSTTITNLSLSSSLSTGLSDTNLNNSVKTTILDSEPAPEYKKIREPKISKKNLQQQKYEESIRAKQEAEAKAAALEKAKIEQLEQERKRRKEIFQAQKEQEKQERENQKMKEEAVEAKLKETISSAITEKQKACLDQVFLKCWQLSKLKSRRLVGDPISTEDKEDVLEQHPLTQMTKHYAMLYEVFRCFQMMKTYKDEQYVNPAFEQHAESTEEANLYKGFKRLRNRIIHRGTEIMTKEDLELLTDEILKKFPKKFLNQENKEFVNLWAYSLTEQQRKDWICEFGLTKSKERYKLFEHQLMLDQTDLYRRLDEFNAELEETKEEPEKIIAMVTDVYLPQIREMIKTIDSKSRGLVGLQNEYSAKSTIFIHTYFFELLALRMLITICGELSDVTQHSNSPEFKSFMTYCRKVRNEVGHEVDDYRCKVKPDLDFFIHVWSHIINIDMRKLHSVSAEEQPSSSSTPHATSAYHYIHHNGFYGANNRKKKNPTKAVSALPLSKK